MLGPVAGGWLTDNYSWRWVFYINVPIGVASLVLTQLFIFDPPYLRRQKTGIDYWGIGLLAVGIGSLQIMLDKGQEADWFGSRFIVTLCILAVGGLTALIIRELKAEHPVLDLTVFKYRSFAIGTFLMTLIGFVLYGSTVLLPLLMQVQMCIRDSFIRRRVVADHVPQVHDPIVRRSGGEASFHGFEVGMNVAEHEKAHRSADLRGDNRTAGQMAGRNFDQRRQFDRATGNAPGAAWLESTARWQARYGRHSSLDSLEWLAALGAQRRHRV